MATLRELKGRIGSVASSEKITGAMKMISSAKMHRAESDLKRLLPFRTQIETIIGNLLTADTEFESPLTAAREVRNIAVVILGSDDGLCGGYNINIFKAMLARIASLKQLHPSAVITVIPVGRKVGKAVRYWVGKSGGFKVEAPAAEVNSKATGDVVKAFMESLRDSFIDGTYDLIELCYMNFLSVSRQRPRADQLLPLTPEAFTTDGVKALCRPCIFEPSAQEIFTTILPMYMLALTQEVFTENRASEQAARVMAMQSANDNAKNLLGDLQLEYNKLRQQAITNELLDILGGQSRD
ncbi:MAG: ATP synthase F1 subunit gamma [Duncaniella sp.]|nr:ATP synthase F1 subunit gamma [Duncaniella sp.]